jgi:hypothetical protein
MCPSCKEAMRARHDHVRAGRRQRASRLLGFTIIAATIGAIGAMAEHPVARAAMISFVTLGLSEAGDVEQARHDLRVAQARLAALPPCRN